MERMSIEKGRRSSESTPMVVRHSENSSPRTGPKKEGGDSATPTVDIFATNKVDTISIGRRKRKMIIQERKDTTSVGRTFVDQPTVRFPSLHDKEHNLEVKILPTNHTSRNCNRLDGTFKFCFKKYIAGKACKLHFKSCSTEVVYL